MAAFRPKRTGKDLEEQNLQDIEEMEENLRAAAAPPLQKKPARAAAAPPLLKRPAAAGAELQVCKRPAAAGAEPAAEGAEPAAARSEPQAPGPAAAGAEAGVQSVERVPKFRKVPKLGCCKCRYAKNGCAECRWKVAKYAQYYG